MQKLIKSSAFIIAATIILKCLGLLREIILAYAYGAGVVTDAYAVSRSAVDTFAAFLAGAAGTVFIAVVTDISGEDKEDRQTRFTRLMITIFGILGLVFTALFALFPTVFVRIFAYSLDAEAANSAARMLRLMSLVCVPILINTFLAANLQMKGRFFRSVVYQITINFSIISFILIGRNLGFDELIGAGYAVGGILSALLLIAFNKGIGFTYRPVLERKNAELKTFIAVIVPSLMSTLASQLFQVIDRNMASTLDVGTISSLNYAAKVENVFFALIGVAVATAVMPDLAAAVAKKDDEKISFEISSALKTVMPVVLPLTLGIIILAYPIIRILLERGAFGAGNTADASTLLMMYTVGLIPQCITAILSYVMIARKDTKTLFAISFISLGIGVALNFLFIGPLGADGLALATSLASFISVILLIIALRRRNINIFVFSKKREWAKIIGATAAMSLFAATTDKILLTDVSYLKNLVFTALIAVISILIYAAVLLISKSEIADVYKELVKSIQIRMRKKGAELSD
ncbi:MAG: murein biosynthesis integral membrane protein MurJ [Ruminococcus sp.]|jgi:putative peptidoglycan lipid II flippase|nr:murein biosynthesis integral membrane protein MurJ [Ruminococcus sp.]